MRNFSRASRYSSLDLVLGNCSLVFTSSMRNVFHPRRYTSLDLVLDSEVLGPQ